MYIETFAFFFRFRIHLPETFIEAGHYLPTEWTHIVMNYLGPNNDEAIRILYNAKEVESYMGTYSRSYSTGDGRVVVGRHHPDRHQQNPSVQLDELLFFNQTLSPADVITLNNSVSFF